MSPWVGGRRSSRTLDRERTGSVRPQGRSSGDGPWGLGVGTGPKFRNVGLSFSWRRWTGWIPRARETV